MNDQVRDQLCLIVTRYGPAILEDPRRCRALLLDLCGEHRSEVNLLMAALEEGVAIRLLAQASGFPVEMLLAQQTSLLGRSRYMEAQAARWAVESVGVAVGAIPANFTSAAKPDPAPPPVARPAAAATPGPASPSAPLSLTLATGIVLELVLVPAGQFLMGSAASDSAAHDREKPQRTVTLGEYFIGKYPVTEAQWAAFVKANGQRTTARMSPAKENHPVTQVSWDDAVAFAVWAGQVTGRAVRLPTEAEWEKAARGPDGRMCPWGDEAPDGTQCNFNMNVGDTTPVGKYSPRGDSPYGVADMCGNVWEWTSTLFKRYPYAAADGPEDAAGRSRRVLRGGSFFHDAEFVRCAYRGRRDPYTRDGSGGFRVVASSIAVAVGVIPANFTPPAKPGPAPPPVARPAAAARLGRASPSGLLSLTLATGVVLDLTHVPSGPFLMGSGNADSEAYDDEKPRHTVELGDYYTGKHEVTVAQYASFVHATGYKTTAETEGSSWVWMGSEWSLLKGVDWRHPRGPGSDVIQKAGHPVTQVSWADAVVFTKWASQVSGRPVRLPTEAEWEKAARGTDGRKYPWGNDAPDRTRCNFNNDTNGTTPVGKYSPKGDSPYGAADMSGNVGEWTGSLYKGYPLKADDGREEVANRGPRVLRGGSFYDNARIVRSAYRGSLGPSFRDVRTGFRVAASRI